jgi:hypothetical protein
VIELKQKHLAPIRMQTEMMGIFYNFPQITVAVAESSTVDAASIAHILKKGLADPTRREEIELGVFRIIQTTGQHGMVVHKQPQPCVLTTNNAGIPQMEIAGIAIHQINLSIRHLTKFSVALHFFCSESPSCCLFLQIVHFNFFKIPLVNKGKKLKFKLERLSIFKTGKNGHLFNLLPHWKETNDFFFVVVEFLSAHAWITKVGSPARIACAQSEYSSKLMQPLHKTIKTIK